MMDNVTKQKLVTEFETMKLIEQDAHDFYVKASQDQSVKDERVRNCFSKIAEDERYHIELVDRIMNILKNCLSPTG
jgi:rubrerythrin